MQETKKLPVLNYQELFDLLPAMYLIMTKDFYIIRVNDAHLRTTGTKREEVEGRLIFDVFTDNPNDPKATGSADLKASLQRVVQTCKKEVMPLLKYEVLIPGSERFEERYWLITNTPILDDQGEIRYIINSSDEVTDFVRANQGIQFHDEIDGVLKPGLKKMESEVYQSSIEVADANRKLIQQLTISNQELERFAYAAAHDLKTPLHSIDNLSQWIEEDLADKLGESKVHLDKLRQQVQMMSKLLDDLLEYSRLEQKFNQDSKKIINGETLINNIVVLINPAKGFEIRVADNFKQLQIPKMPLQQIFFNLIQNALKYHGKTQGLIDIKMEENDNEYIFTVSDDGQGIAPEYHQKIFEMFQTLSPRAHKDGTGMGLAFVKKLVNANGGDIRVESQVGKGASFIFTWAKT